MLHVRVIAPSDQSSAVVELLAADPGVTHLVVLPGAARQPAGDYVTCDVVRESADGVLSRLQELGVEAHGAIAADDVELTLSEAADRAAEEAPGHGEDAVVWDEIAAKTGEQTVLTGTFLALIVVATMIAGIGVLLDQPILIVGAMVVGPEFGPLAALCVALLRRQPRVAGRSVQALTVGFVVAMVATVLSTWALTAAGLVDRDMLLAERPMTDFIWRPDALSWVVGLLAGVAGMLSLTSKKSGSLVGVLISVTTVPAAANVAVASAYGVWYEAAGSALQLVINLAAIVLAGLITLVVQLCWWRHVSRRAAHAVPRQRAEQRPSPVRASRRPRRDVG
ncbi:MULTISPECIES: DUF389 domain-containing protein [unclassified Micromonospora]|uniref:DUF389 domain-containing protein n=1 Tax=unclassified Micromonospora TaxID=2617518 RepID=UPI001C21FE68|nr:MULTISPECIES: DUF389 domain-containing protein [unclassified Micromonospora]MBU8859926.1 DUF389 domain-containing protein [Micromonospora sp. WMMB482]MDM4779450.1 DUF389 domain-containing protein [Micromonospora sp. b486]